MHVRFHAPGLEPGDRSAVLSAEESGHAVRVLRVRRGAEVRLFNGRGYECEAVVENPAPAGLTLRVVGSVCACPEPRVALTLAQAVLKGDGMDEVVRDAVMLGVRAIVPVVSTRVEADRARLLKARRHERWQRIAVSSAKQCGRAVVPEVREPVTFEEAVAGLGDPIRLMLAEPAVDGPAALDLPSLPGPVSAAILVGPEGGWTAAEVSLAASSGWSRLTLGTRTLRADAAATVAIPVLQYLWGDL
ncbi:MAG TPA: RsmE family RNA methyltransferase [Vicinamibacterales bacterium]|nr:16S rRNA (uracil(1498)-N(3))-methyltransferase [Acidobacteriota bacterium]HOC16883.1 RsmE family RNA methyltransferase [Vicinamibacterales bacterium]